MGIFIAFGVGLLALLAYLFWKGSMLVRFLMVWVIASVALALPIFGERLLYVPSAGFLMVLSYVAHKGLSSAKLSVRTLVAVGLIILLTCYLCSTITKNSNFWRAGRIDYRLAEDVEKALLSHKEVFKEVAIAGVPLELGKWPYVISNFGSRLSQRTLRGKNLTLKFVAPGEDLSLLLNAGVFRESGVLVLSWDGSRLVEPDPLRLTAP